LLNGVNAKTRDSNRGECVALDQRLWRAAGTTTTSYGKIAGDIRASA
jgi:hypothetical protein